MAAPVATIWGSPTASKRVLLIHSFVVSSQIWNHLAQDFASRGYFVVAPDIPGHGHAKPSSARTIPALADELRPWFSAPWCKAGDAPYDIVIAHLFGGLLTAALLPHLASVKPVRVVLVDPPLEAAPERAAKYKQAILGHIHSRLSPEALQQQHPDWTKEYATVFSAGARLCDLDSVEAILEQNLSSWSFSHLLSKTPDNVKVTVLAADPSKDPRARKEHLTLYPHVTVKVVQDGHHSTIPIDKPEAIIEAALES